ncbi:MAG: protein-glutamate O-methyltransferase CheR [Pseudomonadota bacterium]
MQESTFNELADLALRTTGQHIPVSKSYLMEARLSNISRRENFATLDDLVHCLRARPNQRFEQEIAAALTSKRTHFFREREQLAHIVGHALPHRLKQSKNGRLRVWCAGVSTGQDVWSLAMRLREEVGSPLASADIELVGTDISTECIETANQGTYGHFDVQKGLSIHRLMTNFTRENSGDWTINKDLRPGVMFRRHNLLHPGQDLGTFDLIICTHVISDLAKAAQQEVLTHLSRQLLPGAYLFAAPSEQIEGINPVIKPSREMRGAFERDTAARSTVAA